jgi:hypothetical protein
MKEPPVVARTRVRQEPVVLPARSPTRTRERLSPVLQPQVASQALEPLLPVVCRCC